MCYTRNMFAQKYKSKNNHLKRILPVLIFSIGFLVIPVFTTAQSNVILSQRIEKLVLANGYTITTPDRDVSITIQPNTLNRSLFVEFISPEFYPKTPLDKTLISNVYHYALLPASENKLPVPISISFQYPINEERYKEIYIYNQEKQNWQNLPGTINHENHTISADTQWASGFIAVFADHLARSEYLKNNIDADSLLIIDSKTGEILVERNSAIQRPVASLTKLMTASTFLENNPGWDTSITMQARDDAIPAKIYVRAGDRFKTKDIFYATLLRSANNAAKALARSTGLGEQEFIKRMNQKAGRLHMENTEFAEPTGLAKENVSTAQDIYKLSRHVFSDLLFLQATTPKTFTIATATGKKHSLRNTNKAIDVPFVVIGSKTGYTREAGRCLVMKARNDAGREVIAITLGGTTPGAQWDDMRELLDAALGS
jgi:serine-type D-Ala-D-Ala endopeptidase (penicillin-binding protein 7)